ncbi:hypothetical protein [Fimbriimonas ginsengisoli]|uniref:Lipoprotein n=1 Tax=Fimbriimonas ginsengisoli Gsoil 348 TaxID=661478 RepID=A0A068NJX3_FIMGI|nr:hypothetical protein [Fimbriimonas ginsengisoli]AIE83893.1 hypothetical protein OP10G_0525 [Fimbriimonas ginsengisoli Gsoil 348]
MTKYKLFAAALLSLPLFGCGAEDDGKVLTADQQRSMMEQTQKNNPNMPPEAKAAQARMAQLGSNMADKKGK